MTVLGVQACCQKATAAPDAGRAIAEPRLLHLSEQHSGLGLDAQLVGGSPSPLASPRCARAPRCCAPLALGLLQLNRSCS